MSTAWEIVGAVDRVVVMGGTGVHGPGNVSAMAEFNFWADPEAAQIVTRSGLPLEFVGWDVSIASAVVDADQHEAMKATGTPLAHAIDPNPSEMAHPWVDVMVGDGPQRGVLDVDQIGITDAEPSINLVTHYPSGHFFTMLFELLKS